MIDWILIYKNITGKATLKEKKEYASWLVNGKRKRYVEKFGKYHSTNGEFVPLSDSELLYNYSKIKSKAAKSRRRKIRMVIVSSSVAAAVAVLTMVLYNPGYKENESNGNTVAYSNVSVPTLILDDGIGVNLEDEMMNDVNIKKIDSKTIVYKSNNDTSNVIKYNTMIVPCKYTYTVVLEDSTVVHLNASSKLVYPKRFLGDKREVFLSGEGFFEVKKGEKPFVVTTDKISLRVYGTQFNVNTNSRDFIEAVLVSGSLGITVKDNNTDEVMIRPNQLFSLNLNDMKNEVRDVDVKNFIAWRSNMFVCDNEPLYKILDEMSMWYGVDFEYINDKMKNINVSIKLSRSIDLENIIRALEDVSGTIIIKKSINKYVIE